MQQDEMISELSGFLRFLGEARNYLDSHRVTDQNPAVATLRRSIEEHNIDEQGRPVVYQKYESALYEDAPNLVSLWQFFEAYETTTLRKYLDLTRTELSGLKGDYHPAAMLGRSLLGMLAVIVAAITTWWGVIRLVSDDVTDNLFGELVQGLLPHSMQNSLVGITWLVGMFVVAWYALRTIRNRRQVTFLSTLARGLDLYLGKSGL